MKKVWLTALGTSQDEVQGVMRSLQQYGLGVDGHFWEDNLAQMAWVKPRHNLLDPAVCVWIMLASAEALATVTIRQGLALLALNVQAARGQGFPLVILQPSGAMVSSGSLPDPLAACEVFSCGAAGYGAKIVARAYGSKGQGPPPPYRLDVHGLPGLGLWFEVGPREGTWQGALLGTLGAEPDFHAVGQAGQLPEKTTLNYPEKGLRLDWSGQEIVAWAVKNTLDAASSYFVRIKGQSQAIVFSAYAAEADAEVFVVKLQ